MPNWCSNLVTITGSEEDIAALKDLIGDTFDFNAIVAKPEEIKNYSSPVDIVSEKEYALQEVKYKEWLKRPEKERDLPFFSRNITQEMSDRWIEEYGFNNWYGWCIANWGTKWQPTVCVDFGDTWASADFDTAWSPPEGIYTALVLQFPDLDIKWHYNEPGCNFSGDFDTGEEFDHADPCDCGDPECPECGEEADEFT